MLPLSPTVIAVIVAVATNLVVVSFFMGRLFQRVSNIEKLMDQHRQEHRGGTPNDDAINDPKDRKRGWF